MKPKKPVTKKKKTKKKMFAVTVGVMIVEEDELNVAVKAGSLEEATTKALKLATLTYPQSNVQLEVGSVELYDPDIHWSNEVYG